MARFNTLHHTTARTAVGPVKSKAKTVANHNGGSGHKRDAKSELYLAAVSSLVENQFYRSSEEAMDRIAVLAGKIAINDPDWLVRLIGWLRSTANLRSVSLLIAAAGLRARIQAGVSDHPDKGKYVLRRQSGYSRAMVGAALQRADEPGEFLALWTGRYGKKLPKPVKRGVADAVVRLYTERAVLKYDGSGKSYSFRDVIRLTHPAPGSAAQEQLFKYIVAKDRDAVLDDATLLPTLKNNRNVRVSSKDGSLAALVRDDKDGAALTLRLAGVTWESLSGLLNGPMDAPAWEAVISSMGYMAKLRNLRNFYAAGVDPLVLKDVLYGLSDPEQVAKSKQLPMRFLSAFNANRNNLAVAATCEEALNHSLANVPSLPGRTLVLVDRSGSMFGGISEKSGLTRADSAAIFGTALALRAENADLIQFGTTSRAVRFNRGDSVLPLLGEFDHLGGTDTAQAVQDWYRGHDRVIIVTDEQYSGWGADPLAAVPKNIPVYTWNLAGYRVGGVSTPTRITFGGLSDASFGIVNSIEQGQDGSWPF